MGVVVPENVHIIIHPLLCVFNNSLLSGGGAAGFIN